VKDALDAWSEFLNKAADVSGREHYRLYHAAFRDFLATQIDLAPYHAAIAETALDRLPGWRQRARPRRTP
jgi:hypothetical protein